MTSIRNLSSGKTSRECSRSRTTRSGVSLPQWLARMQPSFRQAGKSGRALVWLLDPRDKSLGASLTRGISEFPSEGAVFSSLPDVLEGGRIPPKYFLSRKACQGILTRAKKRNKKLPPILKYALEQQAKGYVAVAEPLEAPVLLEGEVTGTMPARNESGGGLGTDFEVAGGVQVVAVEQRLAHTLRGEGHDASEDGSGRGRPLVVCRKRKEGASRRPSTALVYSLRIANRGSNGKGVGDIAYTLDGSGPCAVAYTVSIGKQRMRKGSSHAPNSQSRKKVVVSLEKRNNNGVSELGGGIANSLLANPGTGHRPAIMAKDSRMDIADVVLVIRYLMPIECERLQGVPDNYTLIPWRKGFAADGPRYKAVGNGMAVPCVAWVIARLHRACSARLRAV